MADSGGPIAHCRGAQELARARAYFRGVAVEGVLSDRVSGVELEIEPELLQEQVAGLRLHQPASIGVSWLWGSARDERDERESREAWVLLHARDPARHR